MSPAPDLYAISDRHVTAGADVVMAARAAFVAGLRWLQVREKDLDPRPLLALVRAVLDVARDFDAKVLVNGRVDVALAAGAHGVHLSQQGVDVADVRRAFPAALLVGASVHTLDGAIAASAAGAHFVQFGPVFATPSKAIYGDPLGLDALRAVCASVATPVIAVGGIGPAQVAPCLAAGAHGVAVIRGVFAAGDVATAVRSYRRAMSPPM